MADNSSWFGRRSLLLAAGLVVVMIAGLGATGVAAQAAIPGDTLYSLKGALEQAQYALASDAGARAEMKLALAEERLGEIEALVADGRFSQIKPTVLAFEASINGALIELETLSALDPARAAEIAAEITSALTRYAQMLGTLAASVPEDVQRELLRALDTSEIVGGLGEQIDNANGNLNSNENSNLNENSNVNANDNANLNENENENVNGNDNENSNLNGNDNEDDDGNGNSNSNTNSNSNDNGDDDSGSGGNSNDNDDDHSGSGGGGNDNDDDDDNDNDDD